MARSSLSKSSSKLNLSRRQTAIFQKTILAGSHMADALNNLDQMPISSKEAKAFVARWQHLMVELAKMLL